MPALKTTVKSQTETLPMGSLMHCLDGQSPGGLNPKATQPSLHLGFRAPGYLHPLTQTLPIVYSG